MVPRDISCQSDESEPAQAHRPNTDAEGQEAQTFAIQQKDSRGPQQVEVLFDGKGPEDRRAVVDRAGNSRTDGRQVGILREAMKQAGDHLREIAERLQEEQFAEKRSEIESSRFAEK